MKIISIGTEQNLFNKESKTFTRIKEYSFLAKENIYLVFVNDENKKNISEKVGENFFKVIPVFGKNKIQQILNLFRIFKSELGENFDTKNILVSSQDAFEIGLLSFLLVKKFGLKLLLQVHTDISSKLFKNESLRNFLQLQIAKIILKKAYKIRVVSERIEKYLLEDLKINKNKIFLLPIYTDFSQFQFSFKKEKNEPLKILMLSRIEKVKNIPLGISVVEELRKRTFKNIILKIVGKGSLQEKYKKTFADKNWVEWFDWTENVQKEYHEADIFLISSNYEGWGMTAVESVASGTPVCMTNVGLAGEFIFDGVSGFISKSHSKEDLAKTIQKCLEFNFDEKVMQNSLQNLDSKEKYFEKLKNIFE